MRSEPQDGDMDPEWTSGSRDGGLGPSIEVWAPDGDLDPNRGLGSEWELWALEWKSGTWDSSLGPGFRSESRMEVWVLEWKSGTLDGGLSPLLAPRWIILPRKEVEPQEIGLLPRTEVWAPGWRCRPWMEI